MVGKSAFVIALASAVVLPAIYGCQASFHAGSEPAAAPTTPAPAPPPPPPPPPPAETAAPAPPPPPPAAPAAVVVKGDSVQIPGQIEFDTGKATFKAGGGSDAVIDQLKIFLDQNPKVTKLRIEGHTDNAGTPDGNITLSGERALTVKNAAIAKGVKKERLLAVGFGQNKPIGDNTTEEGRAKNRRTEFRIAEIGGKKYLGLDPTGGGKVFGE
ncbi:MAG TPA: OmpA family protein [Polyangiaceae bacterium]|nr:OmpA family protein [Polyangiaceae bacterium]